MVDLKPHNLEAYGKIKEALSNGKNRVAVSHATGSGKSYLIAQLCEDHNEDRKLILVPSKYIREQMQKLFTKYKIQNYEFMVYQKFIKLSDDDIASLDYKLIVLDEYHHNTSKVWGAKVKCLLESHPESNVFGTSATPVRSDGVNTIDELFEGSCASELSLSEAIAKKIVPIPTYVSAMYSLDDELERLREKVKNATNTKEEKAEFYEKIKAMRIQIDKAYGMPIILNKYLKNKEGKYLVFCRNKAHLEDIKDTVIEWFKTAGFKDINSYMVYSSYEQRNKEYVSFCNDKSHKLKLLFSVNMLNEGLHLSDISGVLLLRPTNSNIVWHQQIGRCIEANNTENPVIIDATNNFQSIKQGIALLKAIKEAVTKEKGNNKDFDDKDFLELDTFFLTGYVQEIQQMFADIEGQLEGAWDQMFQEYLGFFKQYGHGDIPKTKEYKKLNNWCVHQRCNELLNEYRKKLLNDNGFIWNIPRYRFEKQVISVREFVCEYGYYPKGGSQNRYESNLGYFVSAERTKMRRNNTEESYPQWKLDIINTVMPNFCWNPIEESFNIFLYFYNDYYNNTSKNYVPKNLVYKGYRLGKQYSILKNSYNNRNLPDDKRQRLINEGIYLGDVKDLNYKRNWELLEACVNKGNILNSCNKTFQGVDLYSWIRVTVRKHIDEGEILSDKQMDLLQKAVRKWTRPIKIVDLINHQEYVYLSISKAARAMCSEHHVAKRVKSCITTIGNQLSGKTTKPYKGRFIFQYADSTDQSKPA
ncbi:DEAD/DEAH box helicase family protein [Enterocloster citroniae]|uniref:Helicase ATP-binding domain-containing protein n=1 Tax=[Clostridium] citroniae WAL-17108 TaxID=742733 RepID=G5HQG6_9FIRM|nr:DEAD/DEAH box helicase family protein [Enterocloster citroniae]EHE96292.1 hypothetical protein HMPREF9469_04828 [ [[Clostridium] citroniae WAL-17108]MCC3387083.1 hypothetical protein [Enterocloster citroniae]